MVRGQVARVAAVVGIAALAAGCMTTAGYYAQAVKGQVEVLTSREDIGQLLADPQTPPELRERLAFVEEIRAFAVAELALPADGSFHTYVDYGRPYAVVNVVATPELSLDPVTWCFPVAGCVPYRGYFDEAEAEAFAAGLAAEGLDVSVSRSSAYSTLGWFEDPVPNTILFGSDFGLAGTIFHELSHQRVYVEDDSTFNESYAVAVEQAGMRRWLAAVGSAADVAAYEAMLRRESEFLDLVLGARAELAALYRTRLAPEAMREGKADVFAELQSDYRRLKASWGGYSGYDGWFARDLNNAHLALIATYAELVPAFTRLLERSGGDFAAFHSAVEALARLPKVERDSTLAGLEG